MLIKEQVPAVVSPSPNSFAGLMELYELNYIQLRLLLGEHCKQPGQWIAQVANHLPILLEVKDCTPHTSTIILTYLFGHSDPQLALERKPDLHVRICHDALQAEVISHRCRLTNSVLNVRHLTNTDSLLQCRWRINRFLFKWLNHLRRKGYQFNSE